MVSIRRGLRYLVSNRAQFCDSLVKNYLKFLPDKLYLLLRYRCRMGLWINWKSPQTFTEKLQWLKLYNRKNEYSLMVDKFAVKQYVSDIIGPDYIIPTLGIWDNTNNIDWDALPEQFVLKTTHGGGSCGVVICRDKTNFNKQETIAKLNQSLKQDIYSDLREWPYKNVPRRIMAEQYIEPSDYNDSVDLSDYKFFCFSGEPIYCQVIRNRSTNETIDFYDMDWNHQEFVGLVGLDTCVVNGKNPVPRPSQLAKMVEICKSLSEGIPFVRIDMYVVTGNVFFGEMTFFPASGFGYFNPAYWNNKLGELLVLK